MKKIITAIICVCAAVSAGAQDEMVTYYDASSSVKVDGFTWNIGSIILADTLTYVTVNMVPSKSLPRLEYYTNPPAVITAGNMELTCIGALDRQSDLGKWHESVRGKAYGWGNVEPDAIYSYTLVFGGRVPYGLRDIKISNVRAGGYAFSFSTKGNLDNPDPCENVEVSEERIREEGAADKYGIAGVYESVYGFRLGVTRYTSSYRLVCLSPGEGMPWWHPGDVKGSTSGLQMKGEAIVGKASCFMADKRLREVEVVFEKTGLTLISPEGKEVYLKK